MFERTTHQHEFPELDPLPAPIAALAVPLLHANHWMALALHLPLRFEDLSTLSAMDTLSVGQKVNLTATVTAQEVQYHPRKQLRVWIQEGKVSLLLRWLHFYPELKNKLAEGTRVRVSGQIRQGHGLLEMVHPSFKIVPAHAMDDTPAQVHDDTPENRVLEPCYPSGNDIKQWDWKRWMAQIPATCYDDTLSASVLRQHKLLPWKPTLETLHGQAQADVLDALNQRTHPAWQRVKVDELLAQQLLMQTHRLERTQQKAVALGGLQLESHQSLLARFIRLLPFELTGAQQRALREIQHDLAQTHPMQRLLQGDVGSGKTLVAALACLQAVEQGHQAALLAPTEILAEQHHHKLKPLFDKVGVRCAKLVGALKKSEKNAIHQALLEGEIDVVIGTHALVQDAVQFKSLALVVVDEQHRFGVEQRLKLIGKADGARMAHQLMMSATPIPRTLAQTYLSDLCVSSLDEKPPGRKEIMTKLLSQSKREQLIQAIEVEIQKGQQVYWVCPLIEESEKLDLQAAQATYEHLLALLPNIKIGLLHGKQETKLKHDTMTRFAQGHIDLLVSTTVIEVGVDVGNASLMVIDQAERFGLAQLHQLRGRVGRGTQQSVCILLYGAPLSNISKMRLKAMHESNDGFFLAEKDLEIRGPGELLGKRQSGVPLLRYADPLTEKHLLDIARSIAKEMAPGSREAIRHIRRWTQETPWWLS